MAAIVSTKRRGDEVVVRRGVAPGTGAPDRLKAAARAYTGDVSGAKGVVLGTQVREVDGRETEIATVAVTDAGRDGRATGLLDIPTERLRHTGFHHTPEHERRASIRCFARRFFGGAGESRVLHGNAKIDTTPKPVERSPFAHLVGE